MINFFNTPKAQRASSEREAARNILVAVFTAALKHPQQKKQTVLINGPKGYGKRLLLEQELMAYGYPLIVTKANQGKKYFLNSLERFASRFPKDVLADSPLVLRVDGIDSAETAEALHGWLSESYSVEVVCRGERKTIDLDQLLIVGVADSIASRANLGFGTNTKSTTNSSAEYPGWDLKADLPPLSIEEFQSLAISHHLPAFKEEMETFGCFLEANTDAWEYFIESAHESGNGFEALASELATVKEHFCRKYGNAAPASYRLTHSADKGFRLKQVSKKVRHSIASASANAVKEPAPLSKHPPRPDTQKDQRGLATLRDLQENGNLKSGPGVSDTALDEVTLITQNSDTDTTLVQTENTSIYFADEQRRRNLLAVGSIGSGKTSRIALNLLKEDISDKAVTTVIFDTQGDYTPVAIELARKYGRKVIYLDFGDPERSIGWNPFHHISSKKEAIRVATILLDRTNGAKANFSGGASHFFRQDAVKHLAAIFQTLKASDIPVLGSNIVEIIDKGPKALQDLADKAKNDALFGFTQRLMQEHANTATTMTEITSSFLLFADEQIAAVTSEHEFEFSQISPDTNPCVLIVRAPEERKRELEPLISLFLDDLLTFFMRRGNGIKPVSGSISVFMDEFASALPRLPDEFVDCINTLRKKGLRLNCFIQSISQLISRYGQNEAKQLLSAFNTKLFIAPVGWEDAEYASTLSGYMEVSTPTVDANGVVQRTGFEQRPVLLPTDVLQAKSPTHGPCITAFLPDGMAPFQFYIKPSYEREAFTDIYHEDLENLLPELRAQPLGSDMEGRSYSSIRNSECEGGGDGGKAKKKSDGGLEDRHKEILKKIDFENSTGSAKKWWVAFEEENSTRLALVVRLGEELAQRGATVTEFFLAYVYSNTDNIQANLHYLDYTRLKRKEEKEKRKEKKKGSDKEGG